MLLLLLLLLTPLVYPHQLSVDLHLFTVA